MKVPDLFNAPVREHQKKPQGISWSEFVGNLTNKFEKTYKYQTNQGGSNEFLITTLKKLEISIRRILDDGQNSHLNSIEH